MSATTITSRSTVHANPLSSRRTARAAALEEGVEVAGRRVVRQREVVVGQFGDRHLVGVEG
jgi:hypothetical protein